MATATLRSCKDYGLHGDKPRRFLRGVVEQVTDDEARYLETTGFFEINRGGVKIAPKATSRPAPAVEAGTTEPGEKAVSI